MPEPIEAQHKGAGFLSFNGVDVVVALAVVGFAAAYFYKDELSVWISSLSSGRSISAASPVKSSPEKTKEEENKAEEECSRDIATRMKKADKNAVFFYGSQTGTAEDFAGRLAKEGATKYSLKTMTADLDHYDMSFLDQIPPDKIAFFVMATYGEGEPTDNAAAFWEFLVNTEEPKFSRHGDQGEDAEGNPLKNLHYVVYGLGNSTYEHYNAVGKKVAARLSELGATRVSLDGFGNDDGNLEDEFMQWKENMWPDVAKFMGVAATENADDAQPPTSIYAVRELVSRPEVFYTGQISRAGSIVNANVHDQKNPFLARVALTRELFAASSRRHCVHVEIDLTGSLLTYEAGDHLAIYPINPKTEAEKLARALGLWDKKDTFVMIEAVDATAAKKHPFPVPSTYDTILRHYLDITRVPTRDLLAILASFFPAGSPARAYLAKLALDKLEHERVCVHDRLMLGEILQIVETMEGGAGLKDLPLFPAIVEGLGRLQPRYYSISSSPKLYPKMVHVTASVLQYNSLVKPERTLYGICTNYLLAIHDMLSKGELAEDTEQHALYSLQPAGMKVEDVPHREVRIPVFLRRSNFKLPSDPKLPIIMVGPGTGVAPFRGFIQERQWQRRQGIEVGPTLLFFGCRRSDEDYLYREEWLEAMGEINPESYTYTSPALPSARPRKGRDAETGASKASDNGDGLAVSENKAADAAVFVAFSREDPQHKHYVQHRLAEMGARVWTLLGPGGGSFYVCGDAKYMAHDVHATLKSIASTEGGMSAEDAEKWVKDLRAMGRYMEDVWA